MNSKILVGIILALLVVLAWTLFGNSIRTGEGPDDPIATGKSSQRTWVIYRHNEPVDEHIGAGDAFRIIKAGSARKLIPLTVMRSRWEKSSGFVLDLVKSPQAVLCGELDLTPHPDTEKHLIVIESEGPDKLQVDFDVFDTSKTLLEQCAPLIDTHRGRAHAET